MRVTEPTGQASSRTTPQRCAPALAVVAGNVPVLLPQILLPALTAQRPMIFKLPTNSAPFHQAVLEHLIALAPDLEHVLAAVSWDSKTSDGAIERLVADARPAVEPVLIYGSQSAVESYQAHFADRRVYAFGPKFSAALVIDDDQQEPEWLERVALDVALFEQQGCLSVTSILLVQPKAEAVKNRAHQLAQALENLTDRLPLPPSGDVNSTAARHLLDSEVLAGSTVAGDLSTGGAVVVAATMRPSPGARTVSLVAQDHLQTALSTIEQMQDQTTAIQGIAIAGVTPQTTAMVKSRLTALGIERIVEAGSLQHTDPDWKNGGIDLVQVLSRSNQSVTQTD